MYVSPSLAKTTFSNRLFASSIKRSLFLYLVEKCPSINWPTFANEAILAACSAVLCKVFEANSLCSFKNVDSDTIGQHFLFDLQSGDKMLYHCKKHNLATCLEEVLNQYF